MVSSASRPSTPIGATPAGIINNPTVSLLARAHSQATATQIYTDKLQHKPLLLKPTAGTAPEDKRALRRHIRFRKIAYALKKQKPRPLSAKEKRKLGVYDLKRSSTKSSTKQTGHQPIQGSDPTIVGTDADEAVPGNSHNANEESSSNKKRKNNTEINYALFTRLNQLWNGYMLEILGYTPGPNNNTTTTSSSSSIIQQKTITATSTGSILASADFHGAKLQVVRCNDVTKVGIQGIVARDTKYTFVLVTPKDEIRTVPKKGAVFRYEVRLTPSGGSQPSEAVARKEHMDVDVSVADGLEGPRGGGDGVGEAKKLVFELHGSQFEYRPAERANRKFKWRVMDYL